MAQAATMGPPLSPREPRRSGRRSAPSASASTSKSPDSDSAPPPPRVKEGPNHRRSLSTSTTNGKGKRPKTEDLDDAPEDGQSAISPVNGSSTPHSASGNGRNKRKPKEKDRQVSVTDSISEASSRKTVKAPVVGIEDASVEPADDEEDDQGVTRCVCGSTEDDPDAGEFMVQCETCKVWQHGLCMGFESEDQLHDDDYFYYCELCRPDMHADLLKKRLRRSQHPASNVHVSYPPHSRTSRSHSPSLSHKQPNKRRNTMNSRDANFDESIKEIMEASAAEAAAFDSKSVTSNGHVNGTAPPEGEEVVPNNRKKRKRSDDDSNPKKRTRSMSTVSDRPILSTVDHEETPTPSVSAKPPNNPAPPAPKSATRQRRGGPRKTVVHETPGDGEDGTAAPAPKRQTHSRAKANPKRPPASSHMPGHDRRNPGGLNGTSNGPAEARAYRNSHAYVVSQQPLFTSWNLPDYLAHLGHMLPTDTPQPLEVRGGAGVLNNSVNGRESSERTLERGVKVKWPSKRMSVGDMNKRVRALMDWVGREQASALDRGRRREALEKALKEAPARRLADVGSPMVLDQATPRQSPAQNKEETSNPGPASGPSRAEEAASSEASTMTMMESLMEELIGFQERFGSGVKTRERERRTMAATS
ncbi:hypothetical protein CCMSSC00406_0005471 [Pleurotus cornucopiae]|uniref:Uncharacterized protein n=1 Tax=Pleurotus cornucopiae TaxID=5321 RepID=A0ACB7ISK2_PLECO|nr:hypothetical protein CCMSSC00406_0005471 [Pleurotus cornucopiae]